MLTIDYPKHELYKELLSIQKNSGDYDKAPYTNKIILTYQKSFYEKENELYKYDPIIRRKLIENRCKYLNKEEYQLTDGDLLRGFKISGIHYGYSHFSPYWIKAFIEECNIKSIYDPCGGWGHRLLGAQNIHYVYNDIDDKKTNAIKNIIKDFNIKNKEVFNKDSSEFIYDNQVDAIFTCPPYYNTEIYSNKSSEQQYQHNDWLNIWWKKTVQNSIYNKPKYFAFVINNKYKNDMLNICKQYMTLITEIEIGKNRNKSHFNSKNKEYLCIFNNY